MLTGKPAVGRHHGGRQKGDEGILPNSDGLCGPLNGQRPNLVGIPVKVNIDSAVKPNGVPERR
jgi:hypothetical protein